jgi:hypothetical protein
MTVVRSRGAAALCLLALAHLPSAQGGATATSTRGLVPAAPLEVALYDRTAGRLLPLHEHRGELYVAGEPGHEYELRLRNAGDTRVMAVTSVDGVNVITGRTAAVDQPGYVLQGGASAQIDGWRKSLGDVASFEFTTPRRSYAARTGRAADVGVIGIAMFRELPAYARFEPLAAAADRTDPGAGAPSEAAADKSVARRAAAAESAQAAAPALGTAHGSRRDSPVTRTHFERASARPDAVIRIYYDSERQLVARGVLEPPAQVAQRRPEPFPAGFVPDP